MSEGHTERLETALAGRYKIERKLGEGGMATVYLAEDIKHKRKVAIKILRPELAAVIGAERFLAEITTTANLQHPHILPLFDSGEADGFLYYVMPFIDGETLGEKLKRERQLGVDEAVRITRDVADALHYAHQAGVIHRDIKPANILLNNGRPVVADFGIALAVSEAGGGRMTETGLSLGTPHYMSPEQASADRDLSARSDVYSLGCVLYEMIAGQPPHTGPSAQSILVRILTQTPTDLTELRHTVPTNVAAAVAKAIEKLPADRFDTASDFAAALADPAFVYAAAGRGAAGGSRAGAAPAGLPSSASWFSHGASKAAVAAVAALGLALAAVASAGVGSTDASGAFEPAVVRFELGEALDSMIASSELGWDLSRDGSSIAIVDGEGHYLPSGHLVYGRFDRSLVVVPFDVETRSLSGQSVSIMDSLGVISAATIAYFRMSEAGTAIYVRGGEDPSDLGGERRMARVQPDGRIDMLDMPPGRIDDPAVSPDGRKVAYLRDQTVRIYDLSTGAEGVFSTENAVGKPLWSMDGAMLSHLRLGGGEALIATVVGPSDRSTPPTLVRSEAALLAATGFTPDGSRLLVTSNEAANDDNSDLYTIDLDGGNPTPYLEARWNEENGAISPDGRWVAYVSDQTGSDQVYVRSFPDPGPLIDISRGQGDRRPKGTRKAKTS